jgi:intein-encoded DNA endonuclease-like protein
MTSIEWLVEQMQNNIHHTIKIPSEYVEQAKEMHRQEIMRAFIDGEENVWDRKNEGHQFQFDNHEHYYNEAFKKELTSQLPGINVNDVKPSNPQMVKENFSPKSK